MEVTVDELFGPRQQYPDPDAADRLQELVGLDAYQSALAKFLGVAINPDGLTRWIAKYHPEAGDNLTALLRRPPLVMLAGDVGSGKTALAESIGDTVARAEDISVTLYPLSLSTRGQGRVGEMTHLISEAFNHVYTEAKKYKRESGKPGAGILLLVDEADALAQSREEAQMHHEDRAGVNAFIRGVDHLAEPRLPAAVIMCTNRVGALDPAIRRRAGIVLTFRRPCKSERNTLLQPVLSKLGLDANAIQMVVAATGKSDDRDYGCTYSDLVQRLLPGIVMQAYPDSAVDPDTAIDYARSLDPTPPFDNDR